MPPKLRGAVHSAVLLLVIGIALFASAGRLDVPGFWLYLTVFASICAVGLIAVDPDLVEERMRPGGKRPPAAGFLVPLLPLAHWIVAGLDRGRFHWSDTVLTVVEFVALMLFAASWALVVWVGRVNRFASPMFRIQKERGHYVVTTGPYALMRHPSYAAALTLCIVSGLALGSWLAVLVLVPAIPFLVWATATEDQLLKERLSGYREYAGRVRNRLVPGVW
jgi:protein-S-isoprenylcysteine O-methyltransferase Ste14